jgi:uncharacterized protein (UPF0276 family)
LGVGLGLRSVHYGYILSEKPKVPWFEVISENYMGTNAGSGGRAVQILEKIRKDYPIVMHGVSLSIGSTDPLDKEYLKKLKRLAGWAQPLWVSDHLCWTGVAKENLHDLLPLPYTRETVKHLINRVSEVQDILGRQILLENVSSYITFAHSEMTEWECLAEVAKGADCKLLLDVNNVYVSSVNHGFNPVEFLKGIPMERVDQFHLAKYSNMGTHLIDTHDHAVTSPVWNLYKEALLRFGEVPTLIEWDDKIPDFPILQKEAFKAERLRKKVLNNDKKPIPVLV